MSSRLQVALKTTGTSALKIVGILIAQKLLSRGMSTPIVYRILVALAACGQECQLPLLTGFW